jgi:hypothetical protein
MKLRIFIILFISALIYIGCDTDSDPTQPLDIGITVLEPLENDTFTVGTWFDIELQLTGYTSSYSHINYYLGNDSIPVTVVNKDELNSIAEIQTTDAEINTRIGTVGYLVDDYDLIVEAVATDLTTDIVTVPIYLDVPFPPPVWMDFVFITPLDSSEFTIGDTINFEVELLGNVNRFWKFEAFTDSSTFQFFQTETYAETIRFNYDTDILSIGEHFINCDLIFWSKGINSKNFYFNLVDSIK